MSFKFTVAGTSTRISTGVNVLWSCILTGGAGTGTMILYDGTGSDGEVITKLTVTTLVDQPQYFVKGVKLSTLGLYIHINGTVLGAGVELG